MLKFKRITLDDGVWIKPYFKAKNYFSAKYSFGACFVWREVYKLEMAESNGFLFAKVQPTNSSPMFLCPAGSEQNTTQNLPQAMEEICDYCKSQSIVPKMYGIFEREKEILNKAYGDTIQFTEARDNSDYIYDRNKLATLRGKKYHSKRNHIARFEEKEWRFEPITKDNIKDAIDMHMEWSKQNLGSHSEQCREQIDKWNEYCASIQALSWFEHLNFKGGILYQEGRAVAYTIGEPLTADTFVVHFEKAYHDVQGAYPAVNKQFVLQAMEGFRYVNREEDMGNQGLRKAKLSYQPEILLTEYTAELRNI